MLWLENGANVMARSYDEEMDSHGTTALHWAAADGGRGAVNLLLEAGADVTAEDDFGKTALHDAANTSDGDQLMELVYKSALAGLEGSCNLLLMNNIHLEGEKYPYSRMPDTTEQIKQKEVAMLLLDHGADAMATELYGRTALDFAALNGYEAVVQILLEYDGCLEMEDCDGRTALHEAALGGHETILKRLLEKGANLEWITMDLRLYT